MHLKYLLILTCCFSILSLSAQKKKSDKINEEENFIYHNFSLRTPSQWIPGERFIFVNPRLNITLKPEMPILNDSTDYTNTVFVFDSFKQQTDWNGESTLDIVFKANDKKYRFETGKTLAQFSDTLYNPLIAGLIWLPEIEKADSLLQGKTLYILTSEWQSEEEQNLLEAKKFVPVTVSGVHPGNEYAPVKINFKDANNKEFSILTTLSGTLNSSSRYKFPKIFSFSNPRLLYKDINDENWQLITEGKIAAGMTQSEVRLSIGKPSDINRIPTYSGLKEQWFYNSGTMINFQDGRVISFRR